MTKSQKRRLQRRRQKSKKSKVSVSIYYRSSTICGAKQVNRRVKVEIFSRSKFYSGFSDLIDSDLYRNILKDLKVLKAIASKFNLPVSELTTSDTDIVHIRCSAHGFNCDRCDKLVNDLGEAFLKMYAEYAYSPETYQFVTSHYLVSFARNG